jgi:hypothetical protein
MFVHFASAVGIATGYGLDDVEVGAKVTVGSRIPICLCLPDSLWGPPDLLSDRIPGLNLRRPSPESIAEVKNGGAVSPRHHAVIA